MHRRQDTAVHRYPTLKCARQRAVQAVGIATETKLIVGSQLYNATARGKGTLPPAPAGSHRELESEERTRGSSLVTTAMYNVGHHMSKHVLMILLIYPLHRSMRATLVYRILCRAARKFDVLESFTRQLISVPQHAWLAFTRRASLHSLAVL